MLSPGAQVDRLVARITRQLEIPLHLMSGPLKERIRNTAARRLSVQSEVSQKEVKAMAKEVLEVLSADVPTSSTPQTRTPAVGPSTPISARTRDVERSHLSANRASRPMLLPPQLAQGDALPISASPPLDRDSPRRPPLPPGLTNKTSVQQVLGEQLLGNISPDHIPKGLLNTTSATVEKKLMRMLREQEWAEKFKKDAQVEREAAAAAKLTKLQQTRDAKSILLAQKEAKEHAKKAQKREEIAASKEMLAELDRLDSLQAKREANRIESEHARRLELDAMNEQAQRERMQAKAAEREKEAAFIQSVVEREQREKAAAKTRLLQKRAALRDYLSDNNEALERKKYEKRQLVESDKLYVAKQQELLGQQEAHSSKQIKLETPRGEALKQRTAALSNALLLEKMAKDERLREEELRQQRILSERQRNEDAQLYHEALEKRRNKASLAAALTSQVEQQQQSMITSGRRAGTLAPSPPPKGDAILSFMSSNKERLTKTRQLASEMAHAQQQQMLEKRRREADAALPAPIGH
jgi:hypothetical protein